MSLKNKFVVLEGLDGAGTTTQLKRLKDFCNKNDIPAGLPSNHPTDLSVRQPGQYSKKREEADFLTLAQLFAADRREHLKAISKHLSQGQWVFCDRYLYSSLAYQSLDLPFETVWDLNKDFPHPDVCLFLECSLETSARRRGRRSSEDIYETEQLQKRVAGNYERAFSTLDNKKDVLQRINGEMSPEAITSEILSILGL